MLGGGGGVGKEIAETSAGGVEGAPPSMLGMRGCSMDAFRIMFRERRGKGRRCGGGGLTSEPCSDTAGRRRSRWRRRRGRWKWRGRQRGGSRVREHCGLALKSWKCEERSGVGDRLRFSATYTPFDSVTVIRNIGFKLGGGAVGKKSGEIGWVVYVSASRFDLGL